MRIALIADLRLLELEILGESGGQPCAGNLATTVGVGRQFDAIVQGEVPIWWLPLCSLAQVGTWKFEGATYILATATPAPPKSQRTDNCNIKIMLVRWIIPAVIIDY